MVSLVLIGAVLLLAAGARSTAGGLDTDVAKQAAHAPHWLVALAGAFAATAVLLLPVAFAVRLLLEREARRAADGVLAAVPAYGLALLVGLAHPVLDRPAPVLAYLITAGAAARPRWLAAMTVLLALDGLTALVNGTADALALLLSLLVGLTVANAAVYALGSPNARLTTEMLFAALRLTGFQPIAAERAPGAHARAASQAEPAAAGRGPDRETPRGFFRARARCAPRRSAAAWSPRARRSSRRPCSATPPRRPAARSRRLLVTSALWPGRRLRGLPTAHRTHPQLDDQEIDDELLADAWRQLTCSTSPDRTPRADSRLTAGGRAGRGAPGEPGGRRHRRRGPDAPRRPGPAAGHHRHPGRAAAGGRRRRRRDRAGAGRLRGAAAPAAGHPPRDQGPGGAARGTARGDPAHPAGGAGGAGTAGTAAHQDPAHRLRRRTGRVLPAAPVLQQAGQPAHRAGGGAQRVVRLRRAGRRPGLCRRHHELRRLRARAPRPVAGRADPAGRGIRQPGHPSGVGGMALGTRFLQRAGVAPRKAIASVGASQVVGLVLHLLLILVFGYLASVHYGTSLSTSPALITGLLVAAVLALLATAVPQLRRWIAKRLQQLLAGVVPRLLDLLQHPVKLAVGVVGQLLVSITSAACLYFCCLAFGLHPGIAQVTVANLIGGALGSAVPTPAGSAGWSCC
ncbi:hypothetical protein GXW82_06335 [Streptacidiphilus sp. 4-A2]|nr:hypothetical protein [Streptacidiphilus sp. 4-A2]